MRKLTLIVKGFGYSLIGVFVSKFFTYLYRIIIAREGAEIYGVFSLGLVIINMLTTFSMIGMISGLQRFVGYYLGKKDEIKLRGTIITSLILTLSVSILLTLLTYFHRSTISEIFHENRLNIVLGVISFSLPFLVLKENFINSLFGFGNAKYAILGRDFIDSFLKVLLTLIFIYLNLNLFGISAAFLLANIFTSISLFYFLEFKTFKIIKTDKKIIFNYRELLSFSFPLFFSTTIYLTAKWADTLMIGYFMHARDIGVYNAAQPLAISILAIPQALLTLFLPVISMAYAEEGYDEVEKLYRIVTKWIIFITIPLILLLSFFSKPLLIKLFGIEYAKGYVSLIILGIGYSIFVIFWPSSHIISMLKKTRVNLGITSTSTSINLILNYFLIPRYGINGAAIATSLSIILLSILTGFFSYRYSKLKLENRTLIIAFISVIILSVLCFLLKLLPTRILCHFIGFIIGSIIYLYLLIKMKIIGEEEFSIIKKGLEKIRRF